MFFDEPRISVTAAETPNKIEMERNRARTVALDIDSVKRPHFSGYAAESEKMR